MFVRSQAVACVAALAFSATTCPMGATPEPASAWLEADAKADGGCRRGHDGSRTPFPVLMYHVIASAPPGAPYPNLFVPPRRFAAEVAYLARHGYHGVTLDRVWAHWRRCVPLPARPVVVSFDDGFAGWFRFAYPVLRRYGWRGTMNLALSHLNGIDVRRAWLRKLISEGWELDSHSLTHSDLTVLGPAALRREVAGSRRLLRRVFGVPVHFFCYPSGRYNDRVIAAVRAAGYFGATTTVDGRASPESPFTLRRIRVNGDDTPDDVLRHIRSAS